MEKLINAPVFNVISILAEAQTFKEWIPMVYKSEVSHEVSHFRKFGEFTIKVPWPWWHRSTYIKIGASSVEGEPAIIICMKSLPGNKWIKDIEINKND